MSTATLIPAVHQIPRINDTAPAFTAETTQETINFHDCIGNEWGIVFSQPKDFTRADTPELVYIAGLQPESGDAGELGAGRRRDYLAGGLERRSAEAIPRRLEGTEALSAGRATAEVARSGITRTSSSAKFAWADAFVRPRSPIPP